MGKLRNITVFEFALFATSSIFVIYGTLIRKLGAKSLRESLGRPVALNEVENFPTGPSLDRLELLLGKAVRRAARFIPGNHNCLSQAIAGQKLLGLFGKECHVAIGFDAHRKSERFESHAWLFTPHGVVLGGEVAHNFTPVSVHSNLPISASFQNRSQRDALVRIVKQALNKKLGGERSGSPVTLNSGLLEFASIHRLSGFIAEYTGSEVLQDELSHRLNDAAKVQAIAGLSQVRDSETVSFKFSESGIRHVVIKGATLAVLSGRGMTERGGGDVDILVLQRDIPAAHALLLREGFLPLAAFIPKVGFAWRFWAFRDRELSYQKDGIFVDLHWKVSKNAGLTPNTLVQLERSVPIELGRKHVPSLYAGDALVSAAVHNYLDFCQNLRGILDVVFLARNTSLVIPPDTPPGGKQLLADTLGFASDLLGQDFLTGIGGIPSPSKSGVAYLTKLWRRNSLGPLAEAKSTYPLGELLARLAHELRYHASFKEALRFILKVSLAFPKYEVNQKATTVWGALFHRGYELFSGRIPHIQARENSQRRPHFRSSSEI